VKKKIECAVCHKDFNPSELVSGELLSDYVNKLIKEKNVHWETHSLICKTDLNHFRSLYVREAIKEDIGEITNLEEEVLKSIKEHEIIVDNLNEQFEENLSYGDRLADKIAFFGGSWKFIILFCTILVAWICLNIFFLGQRPFDPYPFILLNLVLSCIAAIQAPFIMMSQNRQATKDRLRAELDYKINLKAELEIRHLKIKLDQLASHQWRRLLEIQELQTELMEDIIKSRDSLHK
jgi:uncharacterized membrane protein